MIEISLASLIFSGQAGHRPGHGPGPAPGEVSRARLSAGAGAGFVRGDLLDAVYDDLMEFLAQQEMFENILGKMSAYLEHCRLAPGQQLIGQDQVQDSIFFLESGKVTALMEQPGGKRMRLRTMGPGAVVGEQGLYLGDTAQESVVAELPSVL